MMIRMSLIVLLSWVTVGQSLERVAEERPSVATPSVDPMPPSEKKSEPDEPATLKKKLTSGKPNEKETTPETSKKSEAEQKREPAMKLEPEKQLEPEKKLEPAGRPMVPEGRTEPPGESEEALIIERLTKNSRDAEERLAQPDPGEETQRLQDMVLKDIDELIQRLKNPPPPNPNQSESNSSSDQQPPPMGQPPTGGGSSSPRRNQGSRQQRQQRREQRRQQQSANRTPMGGQQPQGGRGEEQANRSPMGGQQPQGGQEPMGRSQNAGAQAGRGGRDPAGFNPPSDTYKDVWGHLPEKIRQEMDSYFRERFMPRYAELLKQYYSNIAEQGKKR